MSAKNLDKKGRFRSVTVAFRMSPEESDLLNHYVKISGLTKQDYIINNVFNKGVVINGNPRVFRHIKNELIHVTEELRRMNRIASSSELFELIEHITDVCEKMNNL